MQGEWLPEKDGTNPEPKAKPEKRLPRAAQAYLDSLRNGKNDGDATS